MALPVSSLPPSALPIKMKCVQVEVQSHTIVIFKNQNVCFSDFLSFFLA
jgi:hypothetical protein